MVNWEDRYQVIIDCLRGSYIPKADAEHQIKTIKIHFCDILSHCKSTKILYYSVNLNYPKNLQRDE